MKSTAQAHRVRSSGGTKSASLEILAFCALAACGKEPRDGDGGSVPSQSIISQRDFDATMVQAYGFSSNDLLRQVLVEQALCSGNIGMFFGPSSVAGQVYVRKELAAGAKTLIEGCPELTALDANDGVKLVPTDARAWRRTVPLASAPEAVSDIGEPGFAKIITRAFKRERLASILAAHTVSLITLRAPKCGSCGRQCKQLQLWEKAEDSNAMKQVLEVVLLDNSDYGRVYLGLGADITPPLGD